MLCVNGRVWLVRKRWHDPRDGSEAPADAWLDEAEASISDGVREMICRVNQHAGSFRKAADDLGRTAHLEISKETLRQVVEGEGKTVLRAMQRGELRPDWTAADCQTEQGLTRVYAGCDGVKVPLVKDEEKRQRRAKIREQRQRCGRKRRPLPRAKVGADCAYKDFKVGYLYDETKTHRLVHVVAGDHEAAGRMMSRMGLQVDLENAQESVALVDGAPWIRNQLELHGLVDAIGLDFYHLQENVQKARRGVFGEESPEGKTWLADLMHVFKHDGFDPALDRLTAWCTELRRSKRAAAKQLLQYIAERHDMIRYPEFRAKHWQIGSGPTEAECKTTTWRVKGRGRRWDSDNAEAMMALAALEDSGLWQQRWTTFDLERN